MPGEGDDVRGDVERVRGGSGDDVLTGAPGFQTLVGGPGDDLLFALDGAADLFDCGSGSDTVSADPQDSLTACES